MTSLTSLRLYRLSAILLLVFAVAHTIGFLTFRPPTAEGEAVRQAMDRVHFYAGSHNASYGDVYRGFGLYISACVLFLAFLAWQLGALAQEAAVRTIGWGFTLLMAASAVLSWMYFNLIAAGLSVILALCLGAAAHLGRNQKIS